MDWSEEEEALISEFAAILSTTPRDKIIDTTKFLMFSVEDDSATEGHEEHEDTTFSQASTILESQQSLLSTTNRASLEKNTIFKNRDIVKEKSRIRTSSPNTFADLLPKESLNPPKLEQATSFEDLLRPPNIYEETILGRKTISLDKKRLMIKEALERIRDSKKQRFQPRPNNVENEQADVEENEDKFEDYEDQSTWGPVTTVEEYSFDGTANGEVNDLKKLMEEHTESNFGMDILSIPNKMETTLLKLLNSKNINEDAENVLLDSNSLSTEEERLSNLKVVTVNKKDPLNSDSVREFASTDDFAGSAPRAHQNPFLRILNPVKQDYSDNIFSVPEYKQDPFLRLLRKHPKNYQDDFLRLPAREQNEMLKLLMKAGQDFDINQLVPPDYKQNPLLRLLVPKYQDQIGNISPPQVSDNEVLQAMMSEPGKFANDFLILPDNDKEEVLDMIDKINDGSFRMELLIPSKSERFRIMANHSVDNKQKPKSSTKRKNPLLDILEGDKRDEFDKNHLTVPLYKQDPLMRQLRMHPEQFTDDFLELPRRKQDTLLKVLKKSGIPRWNIDRLTPPNFEPNPLLRMINKEDGQEVMTNNIMRNPEDYIEDFDELHQKDKLEVIEVLENEFENVEDVLEKLIPNKSERLQIMTKNPLLRFLEANKQDENDRNNLTPPKFRQDPLLRQLRLQPEMYHSDFLELPRRKQDSLLKVLKNSGLEKKLMERLIPPGNRQDPLLKALIANYNEESLDLDAPSYKQNPLLRLLTPNSNDDNDKKHFSLPEKEEIFREVLHKPETFRKEFAELDGKDQVEIIKMIEKSGSNSVGVIEGLVPPDNRQDPLLRALIANKNEEISGLEAPRYNQNPLLRLLSPNENDDNDKKHLSLPEKEEIFREVFNHPESFRTDFEDLQNEDQAEIINMFEKSGHKSSRVIETLGKLTINKDPLLRKNIPKYTQSDLFRDIQNQKSPNSYELEFEKLTFDDQKSLIETIKLRDEIDGDLSSIKSNDKEGKTLSIIYFISNYYTFKKEELLFNIQGIMIEIYSLL